MKVCFLAPFNPVPRDGTKKGGHLGGVERYSECLTRALARRSDIDVTVVCTGDAASEESVDGVRIVQHKRWGIFLRTPISFLHREFSSDYDVFHVPATYPTYSETLPLLARRHGIPCVLDYHFDVPPFGWAARTLSPLYYRWARAGFRAADAVILKNEGYDRISPALRRLAPEVFRVIPNGVDVDFYAPTSRPSRDFVLFVGRLVPFKGVDVLLDAMSHVPSMYRMPLVVAGSGPERSSLERKAERLGLDVRFEGFVTDERLRELYQNAAVTVLPSKTHQESFGMTLVESMACGTPVVVSDLPGTRYAERFGGQLFPPGDPVALADKIAHHLTSIHEPRGERLAAAIRAEYGWDEVASKVAKLYADVAERKRGGLGLQYPGRPDVLRRVPVDAPARPADRPTKRSP